MIDKWITVQIGNELLIKIDYDCVDHKSVRKELKELISILKNDEKSKLNK